VFKQSGEKMANTMCTDVMANVTQTLMADLQLSLQAMASLSKKMMASELNMSQAMMAELQLNMDMMANVRRSMMAGLNFSMAAHLLEEQEENEGGREGEV